MHSWCHCVLRFTPMCLHILSTWTAGNSRDPVTIALHLPALSLAVFNPGSPQQSSLQLCCLCLGPPGFFVVTWSSARTCRSFAKLGPFLFPFYLTRPPYILHLYPVCPTRAANELSLPIGSPHFASSYLCVLRFLAL